MKLSLILASLSIAALQASASPVGVIMISSSSSSSSNKVEVINHFRFGLAAADANPPLPGAGPFVLPSEGPINLANHQMHKQHKAGCKGSASLRLSNWIRQKLGLPLIEPHYRLTHAGHSRPHHHHDTVAAGASIPAKDGIRILPVLPVAPIDVNRPNKGWRYNNPNASFTDRLQKALLTLGPWEGRAVAFVLGCGIGTLLRMIYVLSVLSCRSSRSDTSEEEDVDIVFEEVEVLPAPPAYVDEKVAIPVQEKDNKLDTN